MTKQIRKIPAYFFLLLAFCVLLSCERTFVPNAIDEDERDYVVEGYIEAGDRPTPPWVILTRSQAFFEQFSPEAIEELFVHDAQVWVDDGSQRIQLSEVCYDDLDPQIRDVLLEELGVSVDSLGINLCIYTDLSLSMIGEIGKTYELYINTGDAEITSVTSIPDLVRIDSLRFVRPSEESPDTLRELRAFAEDPLGELNFYRYLTRINNEPYRSGLQSVSDDRFFDGQRFEFPLVRGLAPGEEIDPLTIGLFPTQDTMRLRWMNIDQPQYNFWLTLEFNAVNQGPFSNQTRVDGNVNGALGVWGGISAAYYEKVVE